MTVAQTETFGPGDAGYESARVDRIFNKRRPKVYPDRIMFASSVQDVIDGVKFASEKGLKVTVRSGGHSWAAWSLRPGCFLIDLSRLNLLTVDQDGMTAVASPSTTGKMLNKVLSPSGLMFNGGHCPDVGIGGFLLQGGQGWCCRDWGWSAESIESMQVVTSTAELVTASRKENADLFWAARGAGPGFFGVVVSFTIKIRPLLALYGSTYIFDTAENYDEVANWYLNVCPTVPSDCEMVMLGFRSERIMPHLSPPRPLLLVRAVCFTDDEQHAQHVLSAFAKGAPDMKRAHVADFCQLGSFAEEYARQEADNPEGRYWTQNAWLDGPYSKVAQSMKRAFLELPTKNSFALHYSMAPLRALPKDMAFDTQTEHTFSLYTIAPPDSNELDEACEEYHRNVFDPIDKLKPEEGGSVGIYLGDSDLKSRPVRFMSAENWTKWCTLRRKWDAGRVFAGYDGETEENQWNRNPWE
ncbi:hypothetical protein CBS101457_005014 [Exobasidium rhododendri]|nr:hypothetical protein CBS101457_005014 [Exobasidium rhododendri]